MQEMTSMRGASGANDKLHWLMPRFSITTYWVIIRPGLLPFLWHELEKKWDCMCIVDCKSFTPLVFSTFGKEATILCNLLTNLLSQKRNTSYNQTIPWMRCALMFSLLHFTILTIHESRKLQPSELPARRAILLLIWKIVILLLFAFKILLL